MVSTQFVHKPRSQVHMKWNTNHSPILFFSVSSGSKASSTLTLTLPGADELRPKSMRFIDFGRLPNVSEASFDWKIYKHRINRFKKYYKKKLYCWLYRIWRSLLDLQSDSKQATKYVRLDLDSHVFVLSSFKVRTFWKWHFFIESNPFWATKYTTTLTPPYTMNFFLTKTHSFLFHIHFLFFFKPRACLSYKNRAIRFTS